MEYLKKIAKYILPYKNYAFLNIFFNILYALFGTLGMLSLLPMLDVLFKQSAPVHVKPEWVSIGKTRDYVLDSFNYILTKRAAESEMGALLMMVSLIIGLFLLKNLSRYLAMYFVTFLRNGVLKDMRNDLYKKILFLPVSFLN